MRLAALGDDLTRACRDFTGEVKLLDAAPSTTPVRDLDGFVETTDEVAGNIYGLGGHEGGVVNIGQEPVFATDTAHEVGTRLLWDGEVYEVSRRESINGLYRHFLVLEDLESEAA